LHGRQPLSFVNGSVAVSGYRRSSGPGGSAPWYCTISLEHCSVRSASSKSRDLVSVLPPSYFFRLGLPFPPLTWSSSRGSVTATPPTQARSLVRPATSHLASSESSWTPSAWPATRFTISPAAWPIWSRYIYPRVRLRFDDVCSW